MKYKNFEIADSTIIWIGTLIAAIILALAGCKTPEQSTQQDTFIMWGSWGDPDTILAYSFGKMTDTIDFPNQEEQIYDPRGVPVETSKSMKDLIIEYEAYCEEEVTGYTTQYGMVRHEAETGITESGGLYIRKGSAIDTVWFDYTCPEYQQYDLSCFTPRIKEESGTWMYASDSIEEPISRQVECQMKRRYFCSWGDDFWEWIKNYQE